MPEVIKQFLTQFSEIEAHQVDKIASLIPFKTVQKGEFLTRVNEIPNECYFVLKGIIREFYENDGEEITSNFYTVKNNIISSENFLNQTPSSKNLQAITDLLVIAGSKEIEASNFEKFPVLKVITNKMIESELYETKNKLQEIIQLSPKERYLKLMHEEPEILQQVPLHQIASYLGITPESLSRIRKRI